MQYGSWLFEFHLSFHFSDSKALFCQIPITLQQLLTVTSINLSRLFYPFLISNGLAQTTGKKKQQKKKKKKKNALFR